VFFCEIRTTFLNLELLFAYRRDFEIKNHHLIERRSSVVAYKEIYRWATTCQNRNGFDFASSSSHLVRARKSIFKDIHARLKLPADKFQIHAINWLPDNVPTPL